VPGTTEVDHSKAGDVYQDALYGRSAEEWCVDMRTRGVPCEVVREVGWLSEFLCDPQNLEDGASIEIEHPRLGTARVIGSFLHLDQRPTRRRERSPVVGEQTSEVLGELGFSADEIDALAAAKIITGPDLA
jgi:crotonobetainyl-CoA:carnitine CoA-transferase CaiB-like acyl-CoA transferase